jgi:hypothetical protein
MVDVIQYLCRGDKPVSDGHVLADENGPLFKAVAAESDEFGAESPLHNPFGRLRLVSMKEIAEGN